MKDHPEVSVITPVRDGAAYLEESARSVLGQTHSSLELLIIDDGSRDASLAEARTLAAGDSRVQVLQTRGGEGAGVARNIGLAAARGRYVAFLDCDDQWLPEKLALQLDFMRQEGAWFSYTAYEKVDAKGRRRDRIVQVPARLGHGDLVGGCPIGCSTVLIDTRVTGSIRMPPLVRSQDFALWLRLLRRHGSARGLATPLTLYREHAGSLSGDKFSKLGAAWAIFRRQEGLSLARSAGGLVAYAVHGFRKRLI